MYCNQLLADTHMNRAYGVVYKATVRETGFVVAVKLLPISSKKERDQVSAEISVLDRARHPNVVRYYGSFFGEDCVWVMHLESPSSLIHLC